MKKLSIEDVYKEASKNIQEIIHNLSVVDALSERIGGIKEKIEEFEKEAEKDSMIQNLAVKINVQYERALKTEKQIEGHSKGIMVQLNMLNLEFPAGNLLVQDLKDYVESCEKLIKDKEEIEKIRMSEPGKIKYIIPVKGNIKNLNAVPQELIHSEDSIYSSFFTKEEWSIVKGDIIVIDIGPEGFYDFDSVYRDKLEKYLTLLPASSIHNQTDDHLGGDANKYLINNPDKKSTAKKYVRGVLVDISKEVPAQPYQKALKTAIESAKAEVTEEQKTIELARLILSTARLYSGSLMQEIGEEINDFVGYIKDISTKLGEISITKAKEKMKELSSDLSANCRDILSKYKVFEDRVKDYL